MAAPRGAALLGLGAGLLAAGFGLGVVVLGGPRPETITIVDRTEVVPVVPAPAPIPVPAAAAPAPSSLAAPEASAVSLSPDDRESLRGILDRVPSKPVPSGTGVITGRVRKEDGSPLPGVEVTATPEAQRPPRPQMKPGEKPPERDPVDTALEAVLWQRWHREAKRTAMTDAAGEFRLEGLADSKHQVAATLVGWEIRPKDWKETNAARPGADITLTAKPSIEVRIEVTCAEGPLPDNLQVRRTEPQGRGGWGFNPEHPVIRVEPGTHDLTVVGGEAEEYRSDPQAVVVPAGSTGITATFVLRGRPCIRGKVIFPPDEQWDQTQVLIQRLGKDEKASAAGLRSAQRPAPRRHGQTGDGFSFPDLAPGRYGLGVARGGNGPVVALEEVEVTEGPVTRDLRVPPAEPSEYVVVRVIGPDGAAVADFTATTGFKSKEWSSQGGGSSVKRADGSRLVFHHANLPSADAEGTYSIAVATKSQGGATLEYQKGERSEWTVRLEEPARVEARVIGHKGTPYEDRLQFFLGPAGDSAQNYGRSRPGAARVDGEGLQVISGVQPGEFSLHLLLDQGQVTVAIARIPVSVRSGRNEFTVPLPELHEVAIAGADSQVHVMRVGADGRVGSDRFMVFVQATDGKARVDGLPEGEYQVQSGRKNQKFRVPGTTKIDL